MRLFFGNCHESNPGWGAENLLSQAFIDLGQDVFQFDYRTHRQTILPSFLQAPPRDLFFLQRGDYFPHQIIEAIRVPKLFWDTEHETKAPDHEHLYRTNVFDHYFIYTHKIIQYYTDRNPVEKSKCSILGGAFSPQLCRPLPGVSKDIDILFLGSLTPKRKSILESLQKHFPTTRVTSVFGEEMVSTINRAKIVLNIHAIDSVTTETRVYEVTGCGSFLLTETLSPENPYPEGSLIQFSHIDELLEKVEFYLIHDKEREGIARRGYEEAVQHHTWTHRAQQILTKGEEMIKRYPKSDVFFDPTPFRVSVPPQKSESKPVLSTNSTPISYSTMPNSMNQSLSESSSPLNIGIVTTWFERGAAYVSRHYREILEKQHRVFIYARGGETYAVGDPKWDDEKVTWAKRIEAPFPTAIDINDFRTWLVKNRIQVVFFNEQHWWPPIMGCAQLGIKTGAYIDFYTEQTIPFFYVYDFLVCNTKRHYSAFSWHPQAVYIPWGTNTHVFSPQSFAPVTPGKLTFFHSAGLNPNRKGTDFLLQAFEKVQGPCHLLIHSQISIDSYFPHMVPLIRKLKDQGRLTIREETVSAPGLYHLGDVYVYPSRLEGIGLTIAEAMSCGLPVLTTGHAPMNEFITPENGDTCGITRLYARHDGYYWPLCLIDISNLTMKMQKYVDEADRIEEKKKKAREFALTHLNWMDNARSLPQHFRDFSIRSIKEKENLFHQIQQFEQRRYPRYG